MTINSTAFILLAFYVAIAKRQGADLSKLQGTIQNDILKEYAARGTYIYPPKPSMRIITDIFEWCSKELPKWNTISISGYHIREAGSTAVQEIEIMAAVLRLRGCMHGRDDGGVRCRVVKISESVRHAGSCSMCGAHVGRMRPGCCQPAVSRPAGPSRMR